MTQLPWQLPEKCLVNSGGDPTAPYLSAVIPVSRKGAHIIMVNDYKWMPSTGDYTHFMMFHHFPAIDFSGSKIYRPIFEMMGIDYDQWKSEAPRRAECKEVQIKKTFDSKRKIRKYEEVITSHSGYAKRDPVQDFMDLSRLFMKKSIELYYPTFGDEDKCAWEFFVKALKDGCGKEREAKRIMRKEMTWIFDAEHQEEPA